MAKPGDVIDVPQLGVRVHFLATGESTDGAYTEVDVVGRPKGFIRAAHVHVGVSEQLTVLEGALKVKLHGRTYVLAPVSRSRSRPTRRTRSSRSAGRAAACASA